MSDSLQVIFVHIPKTAGGSIKTWLSENSIKHNNRLIVHETLDEIKEIYPMYDFSFACVRNTYDRMISLYEWTKRKLYKKIGKRNRREQEQDLRDLELQKVIEEGIVPFIHFIMAGSYGEDFIVRKQTSWIQGVDIVLRMETLEEDFKIIQEKLNCDQPLTQQVHKLSYDPVDYYSEEFVKTVETYFQDEIDFFGYKPNEKYYG